MLIPRTTIVSAALAASVILPGAAFAAAAPAPTTGAAAVGADASHVASPTTPAAPQSGTPGALDQDSASRAISHGHPTVQPWEIAGLSISLLLLGSGLVLRRRNRRSDTAAEPTSRPGRHRASREDRADIKRKKSASGPGSSSQPSAEDDVAGAERRHNETPTPADPVDAVVALLGPEEEHALRTSPLTGEELPAARRAHLMKGTEAPARRALTTASAGSATFPHGGVAPGCVDADEPDVSGPRQPTPLLALDGLERANRLAEAWESRDVDELAAIAGADPEASLAGYVLAAAAAIGNGDPRAFGFLQAAFVDGRDPAEEPLLGPYLSQLTFHVEADDLGLREDLTCTRTAIGCALACAERAVGDAESAYSVLLELPDTPLVRALRAQVALDLQWPARALRAAWTDADSGGESGQRYQALLAALEGFALSASGAPEPAVAALSGAFELTGRTGSVGGDRLRHRILFERAIARADSDDVPGAWGDLTELLAENPDYPDAARLLKQL